MSRTIWVRWWRALAAGACIALALVVAAPAVVIADPMITATCTVNEDGTATISGTVEGLTPTPGSIGVFDYDLPSEESQVGNFYPILNGAFEGTTFEGVVIAPGTDLLVDLRRGGDFHSVANTTVICVALIRSVTDIVNDLAARGVLDQGEANSLLAKVDAATASADRGNVTAAINQLEALKHEIDALLQSGRISAAEHTEIIEAIDDRIAELQS